MSKTQWRRYAAFGGILAVISVVLIAAAIVSGRKAGDTAPGFELRDQNGQLTTLKQFRGKVVVLTFIDPECTQICPLTTQSMLNAMKQLGPAASSQVQLIGINASPKKTKVADVAAYTRTHGLQGRWRFLTSSPEQLQKVWKSYGVYIAEGQGDEVVHEAVIFLIDKNGIERDAQSISMSYAGVGGQAQTLAEGISQVLRGRSTVAGNSAQQMSSPILPTTSVGLKSFGANPQPVVLGSNHPHLIVFFARWLEQSSELAKNLSTLDRYAAVAHQQGWPSPVAIDEMGTEVSPDDTRQSLDSLAGKLHTLMAPDSSGELADGYGVEDLPWFVLTSPSGKILWNHAGWLSADDLAQNVRTALAR